MIPTAHTAALIYADRLDIPGQHAVQRERLRAIRAALLDAGLHVTDFPRNVLPDSLDGFGLAVAAGGDGTQLDAAQRLLSSPLCAVRLFPETSVGFLCNVDYGDFPRLLRTVLDGTAARISTPRLQILVDGTPVSCPVLNDVLVAHPCPARASRFELSFGGTARALCTSGIWIATQPGSHGAARSAGATPLPDSAPDMAVFCIRECADTGGLPDTAAFRPDTDALSLRVLSPGLCAFLDGGLRQIPLSRGQTVTFRPHPAPLVRLALP